MLEQSLDANKLMRSESMSAEMRKKSLKVDGMRRSTPDHGWR